MHVYTRLACVYACIFHLLLDWDQIDVQKCCLLKNKTKQTKEYDKKNHKVGFWDWVS